MLQCLHKHNVLNASVQCKQNSQLRSYTHTPHGRHQPRKHQSKAKMSHTNPQQFHFIGQVQFERQLYTLSTAPIPKQNLAQVKKNIGCRFLNNQVLAVDQRVQALTCAEMNNNVHLADKEVGTHPVQATNTSTQSCAPKT